jgi:hypothetical protein
MAFKLGSEKRGYNTPSKDLFSNEKTAGGTPIIRKDLGEGIKGEANNDGTIFINKNIEPGSAEERNTLMHEMKHMTDMKIGRLGYDENTVFWEGGEYPRLNGYINYHGEWYEEGDVRLPWEPKM